jgi:hypothetical protein
VNQQLATPPKVVKAEYEIKDVELFGNILSVAEITITADQDLYLTRPNVCPAFVCNVTALSCGPCNYAAKTRMGFAINLLIR